MKPKPQPQTEAPAVDPLVGKLFHTWGEDGLIAWQGYVVARLDAGHYLIQLFEWLMGEQNTMHVVRIEDLVTRPLHARAPGAFQFHPTEEHLKAWYRDRSPNEHKRKREDRERGRQALAEAEGSPRKRTGKLVVVKGEKGDQGP